MQCVFKKFEETGLVEIEKRTDLKNYLHQIKIKSCKSRKDQAEDLSDVSGPSDVHSGVKVAVMNPFLMKGNGDKQLKYSKLYRSWA